MRTILDHHSEVDFYGANSLKQQFTGRHVAPLQPLLQTNQPFFLLLNAACFVERLQIQIVIWFEPSRDQAHNLSFLRRAQ